MKTKSCELLIYYLHDFKEQLCATRESTWVPKCACSALNTKFEGGKLNSTDGGKPSVSSRPSRSGY